MTRRQLSRHERELRLQRIAVACVGLALAIALIVPLFGYWREVIAKGDQPIAVVHGETMSTDLYARYLGYQQARLQREIERASAATPPASASPTPAATPQSGATGTAPVSDQQIAQLQLQILQQQSQQLPTQSVDDLVEGKLVRDEAAKRGITASDAELDAALQKDMADYQFGGYSMSMITGKPAATETLDQARADLANLLGRGKFLSDSEYRTLVLQTNVLRAKLQTELSASVKTSGEQVHARHILVATEDQAKDVRARLDKGEDFAALAKELSTDTSTKDKGGDLDWFPRGAMVTEFDQAAFALKAGEISPPVKTTYGYHIIQVVERADDRPFSASYLDQQKSKLYNDWLTSQQADTQAVQTMPSQDKLTWASSYVAKQFANAK
jgi:foldase protein PrsA